MKTRIIGLLAIAIAISLSAFTAPKKAATGSGDYWFLIDDGIAPGNAVMASKAHFVQQSVTPPSEPSCSGSTNQCLSGFISTQVNQSTNRLKDDNQVPPSTPDLQN